MTPQVFSLTHTHTHAHTHTTHDIKVDIYHSRTLTARENTQWKCTAVGWAYMHVITHL
jgi:hypothetical protein